jgi:hypothetical protein
MRSQLRPAHHHCRLFDIFLQSINLSFIHRVIKKYNSIVKAYCPATFFVLMNTAKFADFIFARLHRYSRGHHKIRGKTHAKDLTKRADASLTTLSRLAVGFRYFSHRIPTKTSSRLSRTFAEKSFRKICVNILFE